MSTHGTVSCYAGGCRRPECRQAHADRARYRRRMAAYGRWTPRSVPNAGARRRIEALMCLGWSMRSLSRMLGWHPDRLSMMLGSYDGISPRNHRRISGLYDRLWCQLPPERTKGERVSAARTRALAVRRGYLPPLAWDDDDLDAPPTVLPHGTHAAFNRHKARHQQPCARCVRGERAYQAARMRKQRSQAGAA